MRQSLPKTVALARDLLELADRDKDPAKRAVAHRALGYSLFVAGELREAIEILDKGAALADTIPDRVFAVYGEHPSMVCRAYAGQARILMGFPESGARLIDGAVLHARQQRNAHSLAWALGVAAHSFQTHDPAVADRFASETISIAQEHRLPQWLALGEASKGSAIHALGDFEGGLSLLQQGVRRWKETGAVLHLTHWELSLAEAYLVQCQTALVQEHVGRARAHSDTHGEKYLASEITRLEALLLQRQGLSIALVKQCLANAVGIAHEQGARLLELRSTTLLARVLAENSDRRMAIEMLAPIYEWFTEGFDTADLSAARGLLDQLSY